MYLGLGRRASGLLFLLVNRSERDQSTIQELRSDIELLREEIGRVRMHAFCLMLTRLYVSKCFISCCEVEWFVVGCTLG